MEARRHPDASGEQVTVVGTRLFLLRWDESERGNGTATIPGYSPRPALDFNLRSIFKRTATLYSPGTK